MFKDFHYPGINFTSHCQQHRASAQCYRLDSQKIKSELILLLKLVPCEGHSRHNEWLNTQSGGM